MLMPETVPAGIVARIYGNLGRLIGGKAAAGVIGLVYMIVAARSLGPADYGVLVLVHAFAITVGGIIEFPGWHAVVRYGARALAREDKPGLAKLLRFVGSVEVVGGLLAVLVAAILAPILGPGLGWSATALTFAVPYSFAVLASVRSTAAGYLQLAGRFDLLGRHNVVAPLVRLIGALFAALSGLGLKAFLIAWLIAALAEWLVMWLLAIHVARQQLRGTSLRGGLRGVLAENPGIWRFMIAANADITLSELAGRITPLVVGWMLGPGAVGLYAVAQRATVVIAQPAQILGQAAYAELARLIAANGHGDRLKRALLHCAGIAALAALPVIIVLGLFASDISVLIGGKAFGEAAGVLVYLTIARGFSLAGPPASATLVALGRPGLSVTANLVVNLGLLPLLPLLLANFGLAGAGWHAILQSAMASTLLMWFALRESILPPRHTAGIA